MKNEIKNPSNFFQHESTQNYKTIRAFSSNPISLRMAAKLAGITYNSICWRAWELHKKSEIFYVGKSVCTITKRLSKYYTTNITTLPKTETND